MRTLFVELYDNLNNFLFAWQASLGIFKVFSVLISLWFLILIIILIDRLREAIAPFVIPIETAAPANLKSLSKLSPDKITQDWQRVQQMRQRRDDVNLKLAIVEADKLADDFLKAAMIPGADMGERLKNISSNQLSRIDDLWRAHRLRNRIAHETNFKLDFREADQAIKIYEAVLKELGAL